MAHFSELESLLESERRSLESSRKQLNVDRAAVAEQKKALETLILKAKNTILSQQQAIQQSQVQSQQTGQHQSVDMNSRAFQLPGREGSFIANGEMGMIHNNAISMGLSDAGPVVRGAGAGGHPTDGDYGKIG